jgi:hypothetical protein
VGGFLLGSPPFGVDGADLREVMHPGPHQGIQGGRGALRVSNEELSALSAAAVQARHRCSAVELLGSSPLENDGKKDGEKEDKKGEEKEGSSDENEVTVAEVSPGAALRAQGTR